MSRPPLAGHVAASGLDRTYVVLTFLQWLPVGLTMAPFVLLLLGRGLSLAEISFLGAVSAVTVAVCELPTGGLADSLGRKPVLVASALLHATGLLLLGVFAWMGPLLVAAVLLGLARALASGPLEAWYVDRVHALQATREEPERDPASLTGGLARGEVASSAALGLGTVLGGALPLLAAALALPVDDLAVPILLAAGVEVVRGVAVTRLDDAGRARSSAREAAAEAPRVVRSGVALALGDRVLLRLLVVAAMTGVALAIVELVTPAWLGTALADPRGAALTYAVIVTVGFAADAVGAAVAPRVGRRLGSARGAATVAMSVAAVAVLGLVGATDLGGVPGLVLAGASYLVMFAGLGAAGPPLSALLHGQVSSERRATVLSVQSLALQAAGAAGGVLAGVLTVRAGAAAGLGLAAVCLTIGVTVLVSTRRTGSVRVGDSARRDDGAERLTAR